MIITLHLVNIINNQLTWVIKQSISRRHCHTQWSMAEGCTSLWCLKVDRDERLPSTRVRQLIVSISNEL